MSDSKSASASAESKDILVEKISAEQWPRLTEEINLTRIDFTAATTISIELLDYYSSDTLRTFGRNLGVDSSDVKIIKYEIVEIHSTVRNRNSDKALPSNIVLTSKIPHLAIFTLIIDGRVLLTEYRNNDGSLASRNIFGADGIEFSENYNIQGLLDNKSYHDNERNTIGPWYHRSGANDGEIHYYLHGLQVGKRQWLDYIENSAKLVKEAPSLIADVGPLIGAYTAF